MTSADSGLPETASGLTEDGRGVAPERGDEREVEVAAEMVSEVGAAKEAPGGVGVAAAPDPAVAPDEAEAIALDPAAGAPDEAAATALDPAAADAAAPAAVAPDQAAATALDPTAADAAAAAAAAPDPAAVAPPDFRPKGARRFIVVPFWAGVLGAAVFGWVFLFLLGLRQAEITEWPREGAAFVLAFLAGVTAAMWLGYRDPIRSYASLFGRMIGAIVYGGASLGIVLAILIVILEGLHAKNDTALEVVALVALGFFAIGMLKIYGLGEGRPRRIKIGAAAFVAVLVTLYPSSPALRCRLGSGTACADEASDLADHGAHEDAVAYGDRGCDRGFGAACTMAGMEIQRGVGVAKDQKAAERLFRRGCALGDDRACGRVHAIELEKGCDRFSGYACKELAEVYARGQGVDRDRAASGRYLQKACLLGEEEACRR